MMFSKVSVGAGTLALAVVLTACGANASATTDTSTPTSAATTAVAQSTSQPANSPSNGTPRARNGVGPNVVGRVQAVNGSTITIQSLRGGSSATPQPAQTVQLTSSTTIHKQVDGPIGDVKVGMAVVAVGQQNGTVLQARQIQLLPDLTPTAQGGGAGGGGTGGAGRTGGNGTPGANGASAVRGTVSAVSGDTITVQAANGGATSQIQLASGGRLIEQVDGTPADITPGVTLTAVGQQQGTTLVATSITLTTAPPGQNGTPSPTA